MGTLMENHNEFDAELSISGVQFSVSDLNTVEDNDREIDEDMAAHVLNGLSQTPKKLSSMYFYDSIGSSLYEKITEQEEYYLYDCEKQNFNKHKHTILKHLISSGDNDASCNIVELGAGDGSKTRYKKSEIFFHKNFFVFLFRCSCKSSKYSRSVQDIVGVFFRREPRLCLYARGHLSQGTGAAL